ncbi:dienelactone hydrolase family protein [Nisaea sp.]|uniref:dienelactone hydrolase family protein n=1 Tax=Nisaea sp. TaxID=2024842 RepID=UPI0032EDB5FC
MDTPKIDPKIYALYDEYCHSSMKRREFLKRASTIAVIGGSGLAMAEALLPNYAAAQTVSFTDPRIKATYETYDSPGGNSGEMRGYLVQPTGDGPFPAVLVIHENRGLNPYIEDVARRAAIAGFLAFAPDGLWPAGGYPGNDDDGKVLQAGLDRSKIHVDMLNGAKFLKSHPLSNGKLGATGFCFGGGVVGYLAVEMGAELDAGVPFYGRQPADADVARIKAPLLAHYAEQDPRVNAGIENFKAALTANGVDHEIHIYPGTNHGFHNNSTPRYDEAAAKLAWDRTTAFFASTLKG